MVTQTFDLNEYRLESDHRLRESDHMRGSGHIRPVRVPRSDANLGYRLDVVAAGTLDVVRGAGGWLFDRVMAGWEVNVLLPQGGVIQDTRPLRILGVRAVESDLEETGAAEVPTGRMLAVSAQAFTADAGVRERLLAALDHRPTEVALWGDGWASRIGRELTRVDYVLSAAARRFKEHALAAAGIGSDAVDVTETLLSDAAGLG